MITARADGLILRMSSITVTARRINTVTLQKAMIGIPALLFIKNNARTVGIFPKEFGFTVIGRMIGRRVSSKLKAWRFLLQTAYCVWRGPTRTAAEKAHGE